MAPLFFRASRASTACLSPFFAAANSASSCCPIAGAAVFAVAAAAAGAAKGLACDRYLLDFFLGFLRAARRAARVR